MLPSTPPIADAYGMLTRLDPSERVPSAFQLAETYPIVDVVRLCARVRDPVLLAIFAWVVQRRGSACEAFEAFFDHLDDEVLLGALERLWAVKPPAASPTRLLRIYAEVLGVRAMNEASASQAALCLLERGGQPLTVTRVLVRTFGDDDVLGALRENAFGFDYAVCLLRCAGWKTPRIAAALARTDLLAFEQRAILERYGLVDDS